MKRSYSRISYFIIDWVGVFIACICGVLLTQLKADNDDKNSIAKKLLSFKKKKGTKK